MTEKRKRKFYRRRWFWLLCVYLLLMAWSSAVRFRQPERPFPENKKSLSLQAVAGENLTDQTIRFAYQEFLTGRTIRFDADNSASRESG